ncbi:MAG: DUF1801 domain-containing protein [Candidatus Sericytochromatia bacterium]
MAEPKTRPTDASVSAFLATLPSAQQQDCEALVTLMQTATGHPPVMWGDAIVGFGLRPLTYASGRQLDWMEVGFAPRKSNISLYIVDGFSAYAELLGRLGKHSTGKSCLYIKRLSDVDTQVLQTLIEHSLKTLRKA